MSPYPTYQNVVVFKQKKESFSLVYCCHCNNKKVDCIEKIDFLSVTIIVEEIASIF